MRGVWTQPHTRTSSSSAGRGVVPGTGRMATGGIAAGSGGLPRSTRCRRPLQTTSLPTLSATF